MFSVERQIFFQDCDPAGVMFFGSVYGIVHSCYEEWAQLRGVSRDIFQSESLVFPIGFCNAVYKKSLYPQERVRVSIELTDIRESRFSLKFTVHNHVGKTAIMVDTSHFCVSKKEGARVPIPDHIKRELMGLHDSSIE